MSEIVTREQLDKAKLAVALTSLEFCFDVEGNSKYIEESGAKPSLDKLLKKFKSFGSDSGYDKMGIRALEQVSKDDLASVIFVASSRNLELHAMEKPELPKKFALLKNHWRCPIGSDIYVFFDEKTENLYLVHGGAPNEEFSNAIDIALCGKQILDKNNIDISKMPRDRYSDETFKKICDFDPNRIREIDNYYNI